MRVDFQCHIFPRGFVKHLTSSSGQLRVEGPDHLGRHVILDSKTGTTLTYYRENTPFLDPERHLADMKTYGIDLQVLSVNPPGVDRVEDKDEALRLSKVINDDLSGLVKAHPDKFAALATIPMNDPEVAADEIRRAVGEMGFAGINIPSNTRGGFYDDQAFDKVYGLLERYDVPVFMHPSEPIVQGSMGLDYNLPLVFGWPFDTTISLSRIVFSGVLTRFPKLKLVAAHGGGMIPFYGGRLEMLLHDMRGKGKLPVKESIRDLKRVYYEAAVFSPGAVQLLLSFAGEDNVVYGTDYPFGQDEGKLCYEASLKTMDALKADPKVKSKVLGDNALRLLKLA